MSSKRSRESISTEEKSLSNPSPALPTLAQTVVSCNSPSLVTTRTLSTMGTPSPVETEDEDSSSSSSSSSSTQEQVLVTPKRALTEDFSSSSSSSDLASLYPPKRFANTFEPTVLERDIFRRCMSMITRTTCYDWQFDAQENGIYIINLSEEFQGYHISLEVELESASRMVGQINYINLTNDSSYRLDFFINDNEGILCLTRVETTTSFLVFTRNTFLTFTTYVSYEDSHPWNYRPALSHLNVLSI